MAQPERSSGNYCVLDGLDSISLASVDCHREKLRGQVVKSHLVPRGQKALFRTCNIKADDTVVAVANRELCNLKAPVGMAHCGNQLSGADEAPAVADLLHSSLETILNSLDSFIERESSCQVLLWSPAQLTIDNAIFCKVHDRLISDPLQTFAGLHDGNCVIKGLKVLHQRPRIADLREPIRQVHGRLRRKLVANAIC